MGDGLESNRSPIGVQLESNWSRIGAEEISCKQKHLHASMFLSVALGDRPPEIASLSKSSAFLQGIPVFANHSSQRRWRTAGDDFSRSPQAARWTRLYPSCGAPQGRQAGRGHHVAPRIRASASSPGPEALQLEGAMGHLQGVAFAAHPGCRAASVFNVDNGQSGFR